MKNLILVTLLFVSTALVLGGCGKDDIEPGFEPTFEVSGISATKDNGVAAGYTIEVKASSDVSWSAQITEITGEWLTLTNDKAKGNGVIEYSLEENSDEAMRSAVLTISATSDVTEAKFSKKFTIHQIGTVAVYIIDIPGMSTTLESGAGTMLVSQTEGEDQTIDVEVEASADLTTIVFYTKLAAGNYVVESVTIGDKTTALGANITVSPTGMVTYVERWNEIMGRFGGDAENPLQIANAADLQLMAEKVNGGEKFSGVYFEQSEDISLAEVAEWIAIGKASAPFAGIYDGAQKRITNLKIMGGGECQALFGCVGGTVDTKAIIKNVIVEGANDDSDDIVAEAAKIAGVVAQVNAYTTLDNCVNKANVNTTKGNTGGCVGTASGVEIIITNCKNYGRIIAVGGAQNNGGVVGNLAGTAASRALISKCVNYGTLRFKGNSGGVVGNLADFSDILQCSNRGDLTGEAAASRTGGIAGSMNKTATVKESFNTAKITTEFVLTSPIAGFAEATCVVENCYNTGEMYYKQDQNNDGGIVGNRAAATVVVKNCYNIGQMTNNGGGATNKIAAISSNNKDGDISGCYYETGKGFKGACGATPADIAGKAEGKDASFFTSGTAFPDWDTSVWSFTAGSHPKLINNPE